MEKGVYHSYFTSFNFTPLDFFLCVLLISIILGLTLVLRNKVNNLNTYFIIGLVLKLLGSIVYSLIYVYFYHLESDSVMYFNYSVLLSDLVSKFPLEYLKFVFFNDLSPEIFQSISFHLKYEICTSDKYNYQFIKLNAPLVIISFKNFYIHSLILASLSFFGIWKLFITCCKIFPNNEKIHAFAILFLPSAWFWGSGLIKETVLFSALGLFIYSFYELTKKVDIAKNLFFLIITIFLFITIKPYFFYTLLAACSITALVYALKKIQNKAFQLMFAPIIFIGSLYGVITFILKISSISNRYSYAYLMKNFVIRNRNSGAASHFDFEVSNHYDLTYFITNLPETLFNVFFKPFIWQSHNILMFIVSIENIIFLILFIITLYSTKIWKIIPRLIESPFLLFLFVFIFCFSFFVGNAAENYGTLVRLRFPILPLYIVMTYHLGGLGKKTQVS